MKILRIILVIILIINVSCRKKEFDNPLDDWFQDPPVAPITQTIKTVVPIGYAASVAMLYLKGYDVPVAKIEKRKSATLLYVNTETDYPYTFEGDDYGQMIIAVLSTDVNTALVSVFFTDMDIVAGKFKLKNVVAFPVIFDDLNNKITAVYASMDINLGDNLFPDIDLTSDEIEDNLGKLDNERTNSTLDGVEIAITQDAWIIDVYYNDIDDLLDDEFKIYGGQQAIAVEDFDTESSVGALQMAMIGVEFSSDCLKNPSSGYAFMQDVEVASSSNSSNIVFGHVFYEFHPRCDGDIVVDLATGNFIFAIGKEIDLGLN
ncbi:MAG: hypothetical protein JEY96_04045 [Bacteroidales bacterium]|nr:hypothetical protein [Bacteroidales bacterium]